MSWLISPATTAAQEIAPHVPAIVPRPAPNPCVIFLSVSSSIDASLQTNFCSITSPVFSAIPFASTFADEWNNNVTLLYVLRSSAKKYSWSQVLVCFSISFLTALSGFLLFIIADSFRLPLYLPDGNPAIPPYGCFLENNMVYMNLLLVSVGFSLSCAMWSTTGLLMSSIFPSSFIAFCTPFVASYLLERITLNFPPQFNLLHVALSRINVLNNPWTSFLWVVVVFTVLSLITGKLFVHIVEKRIRNEIS